MTEDVAGCGGKDERLRRHGGGAAGEAASIGGYQSSAVFGREEHAVEDMAGGVGGGATGDVRQTLERGGRKLRRAADGQRTRRKFAGVEGRVN